MISSNALVHRSARTRRMLSFQESERPIGIQLFGGDPAVMAEAARQVEGTGVDFLDINAGCPVPKVVKNRSGAALLIDHDRLARILDAVVGAVALPVTLKIRIGLTENDLLAPAIARLAERCGVSALVVHARPASRKHSGPADWGTLKPVVQAVRIPVLGNGGIQEPADVPRFLAQSGCAGYVVGRAAIGDPSFFARTRALLESGSCPPSPTPEQRLATLRRHLDLMVAHYGTPHASHRFRKLVPYYIKGFPQAKALRRDLVKTWS